MNVLLIEDDENKRRHLANFLIGELPGAEIFEARSFNSGLIELLRTPVHLLVLDMTLPTFDIDTEEDGGRSQPFAGRDILTHMEYKGISIPTIVVTQFVLFGVRENTLTLAQLDDQLRLNHPTLYLGFVYYDASLASWKPELGNILTGVFRQNSKGEE